MEENTSKDEQNQIMENIKIKPESKFKGFEDAIKNLYEDVDWMLHHNRKQAVLILKLHASDGTPKEICKKLQSCADQNQSKQLKHSEISNGEQHLPGPSSEAQQQKELLISNLRSVKESKHHPLYINGVCQWPSCEATVANFEKFLKHLNTEHNAKRSKYEAKALVGKVRELTIQMKRERDRLSAMLYHLHGESGEEELSDPESLPPETKRRCYNLDERMAAEEIDLDREFYKTTYVRPPVSYAVLIRQAILESPKKRLACKGIYKWFEDNFCYYAAHPGGAWKCSLRRLLSSAKCFQRTDRNATCGFWTVDEKEYAKIYTSARPVTVFQSSPHTRINSETGEKTDSSVNQKQDHKIQIQSTSSNVSEADVADMSASTDVELLSYEYNNPTIEVIEIESDVDENNDEDKSSSDIKPDIDEFEIETEDNFEATHAAVDMKSELNRLDKETIPKSEATITKEATISDSNEDNCEKAAEEVN